MARLRSSCAQVRGLSSKPTRAFLPLFRALGDETRLEIVGLLAAAEKELCVCDIEQHFELAQPTISHHLRVLKEAQIVSAERRGTWVYYRLAPGAKVELARFLELLGGKRRARSSSLEGAR